MISRSPPSGPFVHVRLSVHMYMISSDIVVPFASLPHSPTEPTRSLSFRRIERSLALLRWCPDSIPGRAISRLLPAPPYAPGSNASGHAAAAFSAPQADPTPAVPSAMEGAAPFVRACQRPRVRLTSYPCRHSQPCQQAREGQGTSARWLLTTTPVLPPGSLHANEPSKASTPIRPKRSSYDHYDSPSCALDLSETRPFSLPLVSSPSLRIAPMGQLSSFCRWCSA